LIDFLHKTYAWVAILKMEESKSEAFQEPEYYPVRIVPAHVIEVKRRADEYATLIGEFGLEENHKEEKPDPDV
jgi:hypothetical protein